MSSCAVTKQVAFLLPTTLRHRAACHRALPSAPVLSVTTHSSSSEPSRALSLAEPPLVKSTCWTLSICVCLLSGSRTHIPQAFSNIKSAKNLGRLCSIGSPSCLNTNFPVFSSCRRKLHMYTPHTPSRGNVARARDHESNHCSAAALYGLVQSQFKRLPDLGPSMCRLGGWGAALMEV